MLHHHHPSTKRAAPNSAPIPGVSPAADRLRRLSNDARVQLAREIYEQQSAPGVSRATPGSGRALPAPAREHFEQKLGHDLGDVRIHEDGRAEQLGAHAFARGNDIHFRRGAFDPAGSTGQEELGHELAHVVQQRLGRVKPQPKRGAPINDDPALEREADRWSAGGRPPRSSGNAARSTGGSSGGDVIQPLWYKLENGKVHTKGTANAPQPGDNEWKWMDDDKFVTWKNAGKRKGRDKWKDKNTGKSYVLENNKWVHKYLDQNRVLQTEDAPAQADWLDISRNDWSRTDKDQNGDPVNPVRKFDVGTYTELQAVQGKKDAMEHDHIPSAKSRYIHEKIPEADQKQSHDVYKNSLAIEIPEKYHENISPTYGGKNRKTDRDSANKDTKRSAYDADNPQAAFYRDTKTMLDKTKGTESGNDRVKQLGAYRYLYKQSTKPAQNGSRPQIIDPNSQAIGFNGDPLKGNPTQGTAVKYAPIPNLTAGQQLDTLFTNYMSDEFKGTEPPRVQPPPTNQLGGPPQQNQAQQLQQMQPQNQGGQAQDDDEEVKADYDDPAGGANSDRASSQKATPTLSLKSSARSSRSNSFDSQSPSQSQFQFYIRPMAQNNFPNLYANQDQGSPQHQQQYLNPAQADLRETPMGNTANAQQMSMEESNSDQHGEAYHNEDPHLRERRVGGNTMAEPEEQKTPPTEVRLTASDISGMQREHHNLMLEERARRLDLNKNQKWANQYLDGEPTTTFDNRPIQNYLHYHLLKKQGKL